MKFKALGSWLIGALLLATIFPARAIPVSAVQASGGNLVGPPFQTSLLAYEFTPVTDLTVLALGVYDAFGDGLAAPMVVGMFQRTGTFSANLLARVVVPVGTAAYLIAGYRYLDIAPIELEEGLTYQIVAMYSSGGAEFTTAGGSLAFDPALGPVTRKALQGNTITDVFLINSNFTGNTPAGNFRFDAARAPEPGTLALAVIGALALLGRRRAHRPARSRLPL